MYQDLKAYRQKPEASREPVLEARFDALCGQRTGFPSIDGVLKGMGEHRAELLRVLERPEVPLHNNLRRPSRDYVKKRKISGGTRSESGRRPGHVREPEEDVPEAGSELLGVPPGPGAGLGQIPRLAELIRQKGEEMAARKAAAAPTAEADGGAVR